MEESNKKRGRVNVCKRGEKIITHLVWIKENQRRKEGFGGEEFNS